MKKKVLIIVAFLQILMLAATAQDVVLPYTVIANKMIISIRLNGKTVSMVFDTGGRNAISTKLKDQLGAALTSSRTLTDANGNRMQSDIVNLDEVATTDGKMIFKDIPFYVFNNELFDCLGVEGFIGSDLLEDNTIEINDKTKEITIRAGGTAALLRDRQAIPFTDDAKGMPIVILNMGSYNEARVLFDTGSDGFLTLKRSEYERLKELKLLHIIREGEGGGSIGVAGIGGMGKTVLTEIPEMNIGRTSFVNFRAEVGNPPETLFGYKSLQYGKVIIDYVNKMLRFEPFTPGTIQVESKKRWDLEMRTNGNQLVVATVWEALKGQAEVGDVVTHINGREIKPLGFCESITTGLPVLKQSDQLVFTVKTKQGIKNITNNKH